MVLGLREMATGVEGAGPKGVAAGELGLVSGGVIEYVGTGAAGKFGFNALSLVSALYAISLAELLIHVFL